MSDDVTMAEVPFVVVELPDQEGILLEAHAAENANEAARWFRLHARDQWGWTETVTNVGATGPFGYSLIEGEWRRTMFEIPDCERRSFWLVKVGYV